MIDLAPASKFSLTNINKENKKRSSWSSSGNFKLNPISKLLWWLDSTENQVFSPIVQLPNFL